MAVTLSSSTKQPAKPKISHLSFRLESAIARVIAEGKVPTYNMSPQSLPAVAGVDTDSPHHIGQAVAKIPHSTSPKPSPTTPVHKPRGLRSGDYLFGRWTRIFQSVTKTKHRAHDTTSSDWKTSSSRRARAIRPGARSRSNSNPWCVPGANFFILEKSISCVIR